MKNTDIKEIEAQVILNSKGEKTIETDVYTETGFGRASAPAGTSAGKNEVKQLPGKPRELIKKAEKDLYPKIIGMNSKNQEEIDEKIKETDGTEKLEEYGAAITLSLSIATAKAAADSEKIPLHHHLGEREEYILPQPLGKCIAGGEHADKGPKIQEFLSIPVGTNSFKKSAKINIKMQENVKKLLEEKDECFTGGKGLESGYTTTLNNKEALEIMEKAKEKTKDQTGFNIQLGIDVAASEIYKNGEYIYKDKKRNAEEQLKFINNLIEEHGLEYVEDPFHEEDFKKHAELTEKNQEVAICGDDLFATHEDRLEEGIEEESCNAIIIKPNQVGTLTDTKKTIKRAKEEKYTTIISHRSGETNDSFISHIALAYDIPVMKIGIKNGERIAKINELLRIENYLGD